MKIQIGTKLGEWTLEHHIDSGGNGDVWQGSHPTHGVGALKILRAFESLEKLERRTNRFLSEIQRLQALPGLGIEGVIPILDSGVAPDEHPWYAMPMADKVLAPSSGRSEWAIDVVLKVAGTLSALHRAGVIHRDVKPSNLLKLGDEIVLSDFGLAWSVTDKTRLTVTGEQVGSFGYIAPECFKRSDQPPFSCDVYSLAKTAWVLLTGLDMPPQGVLGSADHERLASYGVAHVSSLERLLAAATCRDPLDRPTMRQFEFALNEAVTEMPSPAQSTDGPAARAMALFKDDGANNQRRRDVDSALTIIEASVRDTLSGGWADIADALGWQRFSSNGGGFGPSQNAHEIDAWELVRRYFGDGLIDERTYESSVAIRRRKFDGTRTLRLGIGLSIEWRDASGRLCDCVVAEKDFGDVLIDTSLDRLNREIRDFLTRDETKYRAVQELSRIAKPSSSA